MSSSTKILINISIFLLISSINESNAESIEFQTINPELNCSEISITDQSYEICNNESFHIKKCKQFLKPQFYKFSNQSKECNPLCGENIAFTTSEKRMGVIVILLMSTLALFTCIVGIINLLFSEEKVNLFLLPVILCEFFVTVGWIVRWVAGRNLSSCGFDVERNSSILIVDGVVTNYCRASFLLRYFFGTVSLMCWIHLSVKWRHAVNYLETKYEFGRKDLIIIIPAIQSGIALIAGFVDADEFLGICLIGNQSTSALLWFVLLPSLIYFLIGSLNLAAGLHAKNEITYLGKFCLTYGFLSFLQITLTFNEYFKREDWYSSSSESADSQLNVPFWTVFLKYFEEILLALFCSLFTLWMKKFTALNGSPEFHKILKTVTETITVADDGTISVDIVKVNTREVEPLKD